MRHEKAHKKNSTNANKTVEVLYQKLGDRWYAFSMIDQEIFFGSITQEEIDAAEKAGRTYKITGNT